MKQVNRRYRLPSRRLLAWFATVVVVAVVVCAVILYGQEPVKYEQLTLCDYWWTRNSGGNISTATFWLQNNGTKTLTISKVYFNQTQVDATDWDCQERLECQPGLSAYIYVAPQGMIFEEGAGYNFTLGTEAGNSFSYMVATLPSDVAEEEARIQSAIFFPSDYSIHVGNSIAVVVGNNGTVPVIIIEGWCNGTQHNITKTWVWMGKVGWGASGVMFQLPWNAGETYNFTLRTACGNDYNYTTIAKWEYG